MHRILPMNRLYHSPLSPFCRKVRLTLAEKKIEVELVEERYWEPSPDFLRRNPAGKVPVLRLDTRVMAESQAICEYLEETVPQPAADAARPRGPLRGAPALRLVRRQVPQRGDLEAALRAGEQEDAGAGYPDARTSRPGRGGSSITSTIWAGFWISGAGWRETR